jgi:hypothetical protein
VIARCNDRNARSQQINRDSARNPAAAGRILAVHDNEIGRVLRFQIGKPRDDCGPTRLANDVAQEKYR